MKPKNPPPFAVEGLRCAEPGCDGVLELRWTNKLERWFYGCNRWPKCNGILPANSDGSPNGVPRTRELQGWRSRAHAAFDILWKEKHCKRTDAYSWLREVMELSVEEAHMFKMSIEQCQQVIEKVRTHGPATEFWHHWREKMKANQVPPLPIFSEPSFPNLFPNTPMIIMHPEDYGELIKYLKGKEAVFEGPSAPGGKMIDIKTAPCVKRGTIVKLNIPSDEEYAKILKQIELTAMLLGSLINPDKNPN